jgi:phosphopantetheinyl transferase
MAPGRLTIAIATDRRRTLSARFAALSRAEREYARRLPTARQRHFALGRLAAHAAVRRVLNGAVASTAIEVVNGLRREPLVRVNGTASDVSVSIAHSGRLGAACAWRNARGGCDAAGIDVEQIRANQVFENSYAFSRREQELLAGIPEGVEIAGLAAWTVKEAVWKALGADDHIGPEAIDLRSLDLGRGCARVEVRYRLKTLSRGRPIHVGCKILQMSDGAYALSIAQVGEPETACFAGDVVRG